MNISQFLADLRNPSTRWATARTMVVAIVIASFSVSGTIIGTQSATGLYAVLMERIQFPMIRVEIESLRKDLHAAPCNSNAMLIAQAADWNRRIEHEHESNRHWFSDWASTDRWNAVERILTPCSERITKP